MYARVTIDGKPTDLKVYVGFLTTFLPKTGRNDEGALVCRGASVIARNEREVGIVLAMHLPDWDLQCVYELSAAPWFKEFILDSACPQVWDFTGQWSRIDGLIAVPADDDD